MLQPFSIVIDAIRALPIWAAGVIVLLLGLVIGLLHQRKRDLNRVRAVSPNLMIAPLSSLSREQFDMLLTQAFRQRGFVIGEAASGVGAAGTAGAAAGAGTPEELPGTISSFPALN